MTQLDRSGLTLALMLAGVAGFVDAVAFTTIGQFFVSFMSGNSTRLAVSVAQGAWREVGFAAGLVALFVTGVAAGNIIGARAGRKRTTLLLLVEALLLAAAAVLHAVGRPAAAAPLMVLAMGSANAVFMADGEVRFGVTYMTGALARIGERLAAAATGAGQIHEAMPWLALWIALVVGAVAGAVLALRHGGIVVAAPAVLLLAALLIFGERIRSQSD
ncbi:YoaK family protein [Sphingomonas sp.]|uniref:YoaK family protein n=1 Tax=Sphingomonas sp. TaxID=28214 RepID=UPI003D6CBE54